MAITFTNSAERSRSACLLLTQPASICPNARCLLHEIRTTDDLPKGALRSLFYQRHAILIEQGHPVSGCYSICSV